MKTLALALFVLSIVSISCSNPEKYILKGSLDNSVDAYIYLSMRDKGEMRRVDSCFIINGDFEFKEGSVEYPQLCNLNIEGKRGSISFFIENSVIDFFGYADTLYKVEVEGSALNDEYMEYINQIEPYYKRNSVLYEDYRKAKEQGNHILADELNNQREHLFDELGKLQLAYINSYPASWITPSVLRSIAYSMDDDELRGSLEALDKSLGISSEVKELQARLEALRKVRIGEVAPDFTQFTPEGESFTLSELHGYKYLLIDFWAGWCGPCRKANPTIKKAYNKYKEAGFEILGVSLDSNKDEWLKAIKDDNLEWEQVSDLKHWGNEAARLYCISNIPNNFLIDENGLIIAKGLKGEELLDSLHKLFEGN